jgi:hypothetical protein
LVTQTAYTAELAIDTAEQGLDIDRQAIGK